MPIPRMGNSDVRNSRHGDGRTVAAILSEDRFLGVDVLWALCMAFNVYLALFRGWTAQRMRAQEWKYFVGCYGAVRLFLGR